MEDRWASQNWICSFEEISCCRTGMRGIQPSESRAGVIAGLYGRGRTPRQETLDFRGCLVFPGVVDAHVDSYSIPGAEGFLHAPRRRGEPAG